MKVSKLRLVVLVLFVVTVVYAVALALNIQNYEAWKNEKLNEYPEAIRPYIDFYPYGASSFGRFYLPALPLLMFCWLGVVAFFLKRRVKT